MPSCFSWGSFINEVLTIGGALQFVFCSGLWCAVPSLLLAVALCLPFLRCVCWGAAQPSTSDHHRRPGCLWGQLCVKGHPGPLVHCRVLKSPWQRSIPNNIILAAAGNKRWLEACHPFGYANRELCRSAIWILFYFCLISCQHVFTVQSLSLASVLHWLRVCGGVYHRKGG